MKYNQIKDLDDERFRRLTGVKHTTYSKMLEILREDDDKKSLVEEEKISSS